MSVQWLAIIYYLLLWGSARARGIYRRWNQPFLRGPEWFFDVQVKPGFYAGPGRKILHRYWMRIFVSLVIEIPLGIVIFASGHLGYLLPLMLVMVAFIHAFHMFAVDMAQRQAQPFAVDEPQQPVATLALSLKTRRLRDYTDPRVEWAIGLSLVVSFALLVRYYFSAPEHHNFRMVFADAIFWLYAQLGFLLAKQIVVNWRTPIPQSQVEEHLAAREGTRKLYVKVCDRGRLLLAFATLCWPFLLSAPSATRESTAIIWLSGFLVIGAVMGIWQEVRRKRMLAVTLRARPVKLPDLLGQSEALRWPVCYQPSAPMAVLKGIHGYSLNLANQLTQLGAAYVAGLVVLLGVLRLVQ
ncbi:MAG TPA: hypothetical protein VI685_19215 [Candidatus Angelobacter sp.]